jgi:group II intron reverse transcriptase/maturase
MSFWGATVITNVRGRKVSKMSRFQGNSLLLDKSIDELSSFQTAKKILWQVKQGGFNDVWNQIFLQIAKRSCCILFVMCQSVPTSVERVKSSKSLKETIENFRQTYVTAKQQTQCFAMAEPIYNAEGRPKRNLKYTVWKPFVQIPLRSRYLERKRTRLFTVRRVVERNHSTSSENPILQNLFMYKIAIQESNLQEAFKRLKAQCAPGLDGMAKAAYTKQLHNSIFKLYKDLKSHKYKPSPIRVIHVPKPNGGKRLLGISSVRDKIVQSTFKKELEILYEPIFRDCSFGFRPRRSCHSALKRIKKKWQAIKWIISLDISKCFDRVQHEILLSVLKKKVTDQETIELIQKLLNVGYVDIHNLTKREEYKTGGTLQGSIISPLLANIYLHELDVFVLDEIIPKYTAEEKILVYKASIYRRHVLKSGMKESPTTPEFSELKNIVSVLTNNKKILNNEVNYYKKENCLKRLHYIRYADDLLLGAVGNKKDCKKIVTKIDKFLKNNLKLELNLDKCSINLAIETLTSFLGFEVGRYSNKINFKNVVDVSATDKKLTQNAVNGLSLLIPVKKILDRLCIRGYVRKLPRSNRYKGKGVGKLTFASDKQIVIHFSSMISSYVNYYMCANKRSRLWAVVHALRESSYLTIAWKHKLINKKKVIEKYGSNLRIHENGKQVTQLFYPKSLKSELKFLDRSYEGYVTNLNYFMDDSKRQRKLQSCALCGSDQNLKLHRINPPQIEKCKTSKIGCNRKTITLCQECHRSSQWNSRVS